MKNSNETNEKAEPVKAPEAKKKSGESHGFTKVLGIIALILVIDAIVGAAAWFLLLQPIVMQGEEEGDADFFGEWTPPTPIELTDKELAEVIPYPEEMAAAIDAMPGYSADDTWSIYVYMIGSDLESNRMDNLTALTKGLTEPYLNQNQANSAQHKTDNLFKFYDELQSQGVDLPAVLYQPVANSTDYASDSISPDDPDSDGAATSDMKEMFATELSPNVQVVIQTGGAKRWQNLNVNPNRSQRFLLNKEGFREVYNEAIVSMSVPETLTDFLTWSIQNYPADHTVVVLWDHGSGYVGYGLDEIYGNILSLRDIHDAFAGAVEANPDAPYFEAIGFDACLMASTEAAHELYGFSKYLYVSEELEPGSGWDYTSFLNAISANPGISGAALGKVIADNFVETSAEQTMEMGFIEAATFSVIDVNEAEGVYQAYAEFIRTILPDVFKNPGYLASISEAANRSIFYGQYAYSDLNAIDLGVFMENIPDVFATEAKKVSDQLKKAVLYSRGSVYLAKSQGLSIFYPVHITSFEGLQNFLSYIYDISDNMDINTLYYYKVAGCLSPDLQQYAEEQGLGKVKILDFSILKAVSDTEVTVDDQWNLSFTLSDEVLDLIQDARLEIGKYDPDNRNVVYYGADRYITMSDENTYVAAFDGTWLTMNETPLPTEVIDTTSDHVSYMVPMIFDSGGTGSFMFSYHFDTQKVEFLGIRPSDNNADLMGRYTILPEAGQGYTPLYKMNNLDNNSVFDYTGDPVIFDGNVNFDYKPLADGEYLAYVVIEDLRSDQYYTPVFQYTMKDGKVEKAEVRGDLFAFKNGK